MTTVAFAKRIPAKIAKGKLGVYIAWGAFENYDGKVFTDSHGDQIPGEEFTAAALSLAKSGVLGHEHDGTVNGSVPLVMPMTEEIKTAVELAGPHSGLLVGFEPVGDLAKSLDDGDVWELSIAGKARVELVKVGVAKSAAGGEIAKADHKRTLHDLVLDEISLVKRGAHGAGTRIAIAKRATPAGDPAAEAADTAILDVIAKNADAIRALVAKRTPALTAPDGTGHQHQIFDTDEIDGSTSYEHMPGDEYGHSHLFVRNPDGTLSIGEAYGHRHTLELSMPDDVSKSLAAAQADVLAARGEFVKSQRRLAVAITLPPSQAAFAKRLKGADLDAFLDAPEAERVTKSTPVHTGADGTFYFATDDERLVKLAKSDDAKSALIAKQAEEATSTAIAKSAAAAPHVVGALLIAKAIHGGQLTDAERTEALAALGTANASLGAVTKGSGVGGNGSTPAPSSPAAAYNTGLAAFAKAAGKSVVMAASDFTSTPEGARLYDAAFGAVQVVTDDDGDGD